MKVSRSPQMSSCPKLGMLCPVEYSAVPAKQWRDVSCHGSKNSCIQFDFSSSTDTITFRFSSSEKIFFTKLIISQREKCAAYDVGGVY